MIEGNPPSTSRHVRGLRLGTAVVTLLAFAAAVAPSAPAGTGHQQPERQRLSLASSSPPESTFFSTVHVDEGATVGAPAVGDNGEHGDLWPSCWSNDDNVYAAYGDGYGFSGGWNDIGTARITGSPGSLNGQQLAVGNQLGQVWTDPANYYRKPTGMACVDGALYLAVQDLKTNTLNSAPAATIAKSLDHGQTWTWDHARPMFDDSTFTTVMFLDYGKDYANSPDGYVYAYGLDHNWRDSFDAGPDPYDLYLARAPRGSVQDRASWSFYTGTDGSGAPLWSSDINQRVAVMHDDRRIYQNVYSAGRVSNLSVVSQGGVVFDKPLGRYVYTSWSEYTFEFYEAPTPWGPWSHFTAKDFGGYGAVGGNPLPWSHTKHGGYATTIPSKYISADGKSMWLQSNVCPCGGGWPAGDFWAYTFSLRGLQLEPSAPTSPTNAVDGSRNLAREPGTVPIERATHFGHSSYYNDGDRSQSEDDWNDENKPASWWGYTWPRTYNLNKVVYTTGDVFADGGWFSSGLRVQVRRGGQWVDATGQRVLPGYPNNNTAGTHTTYVLYFDPVSADGVRVIGTPGGAATFTSLSELEAYYGSTVTDPGFENQTTDVVAAPWTGEGPGSKGIDRAAGFAHGGANNAWLRTADTSWNAITQTVPVTPNTNYRLVGWIRNSTNFADGFFGVRAGTGTQPYAEYHYGGLPNYTQLTVNFNSGTNTTMTVFAGYWAPGVDSWVQVDDVTLNPV